MKDGTYRSQIVRVISMAVETGKPNRRISSLAGDLTFPVARVGCNLFAACQTPPRSFRRLLSSVGLVPSATFGITVSRSVLIYIGLPWNYAVVIYPLAL